MSYFDEAQYDPNATAMVMWINKWQWENSDPVLRRKLQEADFIRTSKTEVEVEFTVDEGDPGDKKRNIPPNMTPYRYRAVLVFNEERKAWLVRALDSLSE
jgi:hypothetical protein